MLRRIFLTAVLAGAIGGLAVTLLQSFATTPLIQAAEGFEAAVELGHQQEGAAAWAPASGLERLASGFLANLLIAIGFAALLAAAFTLAGAPKGWGTALLWGLAGFAAFALLPALGLPPELPGMVAAELTGRQLWWWFSAAANCLGLGLIAFASGLAWKLLGGAVILAPLIVASFILPPAEGAGAVPPELAARFAAASLGVNLAFWLLLALSTAAVFRHLAGR